jgi:lysyl-tRNA synthetase class 2
MPNTKSSTQKTSDISESEQKENEQIQVRRDKLNHYIKTGNGIGFPNDFKPSTVVSALQKKYSTLSKDDLQIMVDKESIKIAGRLMLKRIMGKASFITLQDASGRIQAYICENNLLKGEYSKFKMGWDIGDIIAVEGTIFKTNTGELSLYATDIRLITKAIRPFPDKFHGLVDQETRYRQRYIDLITNSKSAEVFRTRCKIISFIRHYLDKNRFMEVETPMMHTIPGGASARPFSTHHNALDIPLYLRVSPELYLKRLVIGGFDRVYEINRNFRNEGLSSRHNPEFTMIEFYQAYATYNDLMDLTEELLRDIAINVLGKHEIIFQDEYYNLSEPFSRMSLFDSILYFNSDIKKKDLMSISGLATIAKQKGVKVEPHYGLGKLQTEIFEATVEHHLIQPTFITGYPVEVSPLARRNDCDPFITDRFELFIGGCEIANGFSELNDPKDQSDRFNSQVMTKNAENSESVFYDADYIRALEYGMPPTAGEGIGIDRLVMFFTNSSSIRDVILFPQMRSKVV